MSDHIEKREIFQETGYTRGRMATLAVNKRARYDYEILDTFEGGLVLTGPEVKSAKNGRMQLKGAFVHIRDGEAWLVNSFIAKYGPAGAQPNYDPNRNRKILLHKRQINKLIGKSKAEGLTLVPLKVYTKRDLIKIEIGIGKGKKAHDKREAIKKRDVDRQIRQKMKEQ